MLKTLLHNRKTAKKAGCRTTGNAAGAGRVAPTNLFFRPGKLTQEELLANLGDGLYLTEVSGLHAGANPISGDFSLLSRGFEVKGGRDEKDAKRLTGVALYGILMMARRGEMTLEGAMNMIAQVLGLNASKA